MLASAMIDSEGISFLFFLGVLFIPRMMMLWFGAVQPGSVGAIAGFIFAPRIMICLALSSAYRGDVPGSVVVLWIFAIIFDGIAFLVKLWITTHMWKAQQEILRAQMNAMQPWRMP